MRDPVMRTPHDCALMRPHYEPERLVYRCAVDAKYCPGYKQCEKEEKG